MITKASMFSAFLLLVSLIKSTHLHAKTMDAGIISKDDEVILFYKEKDHIVIKQCENKTVLNSRSDCNVRPGSVVRKVSVSEFKDSLIRALELSIGNYDDDMKTKISVFNDNHKQYEKFPVFYLENLVKQQKSSEDALLKRQEELKSEISRIQAFIDEYGYGNAASITVNDLKETLSYVEKDLDELYKLAPWVIKDINEKLNNLVEEIISKDTFHKFDFSKDETGFVYNILSSYLRAPMLFASFQRLDKQEIDRNRISRLKIIYGEKKIPNVDEDIILKPFEIMATEVTQLQWFLVMGTNPSFFKNPSHCDDHITLNGEGLCPNNPVEQVSWNDIQVYIKKLNDSLGLSGCNGTPNDSKGCYRLPTNAEWTFSAEVPSDNDSVVYDSENRYSTTVGNYSTHFVNYAWYSGNSGNKTHPVGLKVSNVFGLYDVHGNVWEFTQGYKYNDLGVEKKSSLGDSFSSYKHIFGGSWVDTKQGIITSFKSSLVISDEFKSSYIGFRLVRTL